jgi:hypothetical protein
VAGLREHARHFTKVWHTDIHTDIHIRTFSMARDLRRKARALPVSWRRTMRE